MQEEIYFSFIEAYKNADMLVIGVGDEWNHFTLGEEYLQLLAFYQQYLDKKNFFIISSSRNKTFPWGQMNPKRIVQPLLYEDTGLTDTEKETVEKQWDLYNKWLSATLNKKLLLLELGEGFLTPNVFRWPFEKVTFINQKSELFRINELLPQIPDNITERAHSVQCLSYDFLTGLKSFMQNTEK